FLDHRRGARLHRRRTADRCIRISGVARLPRRALFAGALRVLRRARIHADDRGAGADQRQRRALPPADKGTAAAAGELRRIVADRESDRGGDASQFIAAIELMDVKTLMVAGGGTGGHIYPAIAIAREWIARDAKRRAVFVGTERGLEKTIVPRAGFPLEVITAAGLQGKGLADRIRGLVQLPIGFTQAFRLIGKHKPAVVLGVGGYSSGPVLVAAKLRGVPTIIHEQNAFPGLTNRILAKFVNAVAV